MADDEDRPSLEAPRIFGKRRATPPTAQPDEPVFEDSGTVEQTAVLPATEPEPVPEPTPSKPAKARRAPRTPRDRTKPLLPGPQAAMASGLLVGLALCALVWVGFRGCEAVRGTTSCGTGVGMTALVVVVVLAVVAGGYLLKFFGIPDPGSASFLGVGMTCVICLVVPPLLDRLDQWSMVIVVPVITAITFLGSWWVTTTYVTLDD